MPVPSRRLGTSRMISCTFFDCVSVIVPTVADKSSGPTRITSMPGTLAISSRLSNACWLSIWTISTVSSLAVLITSFQSAPATRVHIGDSPRFPSG